MADKSGVVLERRENVAVLTLCAGSNAMSGPLLAEIRKTLAEFAADGTVAAVVITGAGKFFGNGLDLEWLKGLKPREVVSFLVDVTQLLKETALFPKPVIGAINGHAFGLAAIWSSGFDFRLMNQDKGWVCFPEMDINIPFSPGMIAICEHGLGRPVFREMAWTATRYTGAEAVDVGWARAAVPGDELVDRAVELAAFMAKKGAVAFSMTKQSWAREVARIVDEEDPDAIARIPLKL